jgi:hypothetical protein
VEKLKTKEEPMHAAETVSRLESRKTQALVLAGGYRIRGVTA